MTTTHSDPCRDRGRHDLRVDPNQVITHDGAGLAFVGVKCATCLVSATVSSRPRAVIADDVQTWRPFTFR